MKQTLKLLVAAGAALGGATLAGCDITTTLNTAAGIEAQVQADTALICEFVPTVATIAALIPPATVYAPEAASIATTICNAIKSAPPVVKQSARLRSIQGGVAVHVGSVAVPWDPAHPVAVDGSFVSR